MAHGGVIHDRESFEKYPWPDADSTDWDALERLKPHTPPGMKFLICTSGGVLENLVSLMGYEELCFMLEDDPELFREITDAIGSRLLRYYETGLEHDCVGAAIVNDDWGFKTQPFLAPKDMREFITPWHRRFVETIRAAGRPAILHSCGGHDPAGGGGLRKIRFANRDPGGNRRRLSMPRNARGHLPALQGDARAHAIARRLRTRERQLDPRLCSRGKI
jgi:hypothetical protein